MAPVLTETKKTHRIPVGYFLIILEDFPTYFLFK